MLAVTSPVRSVFAVFAVVLAAVLVWVAWPDAERVDRNPEYIDRDLESPHSGAYEALALWAKQRAYPANELPSEGMAEAIAARQAMATERRVGETPWEPIGPDNIGGRTLAIVLNPERPETVWAGSAGGGLWRSYVGGVGDDAWERVSTGFGVTAASAVALVPGDTSTIYLGTGEVYRYAESVGGVVYRPTRGSYGMGILKSTDGGATWAKSLDWTRNQERGIQMLRIDPNDVSTVWAATTEGIYVSRDAGATWDLSLDVVMGTDLTINPEDSDDILAACGNQESEGYGLYRTTDGGATWTQITDGWPEQYIGKALFDRHPTETETVYASVGDGIFTSQPTGTFLLKSTNGGVSWETISTFNYARFQGWFAHYVGVNPFDPDVLYLGGVSLYRADGEGQPNAELFNVHADNHAVAFHPTDPDIVYFATDGGVYRTINGGASTQDLNDGFQTTQFYNGTASGPFEEVILGGLQDNGTVRTTGSEDWDHIFGGDGTWTAVDPGDTDVVYAAFQRLNMQRSTNGGDSFTTITPPSSSQTAFVAPYALAPSFPDVLYAARNVVFRSENRGSSWSATNGGASVDPSGNPALAIAVSPVDADVVYLATAPLFPNDVEPGPPKLFVTRDGGDSWADIMAGLPDRFITDIAVHPDDDAQAWVTVGGFGTPHVYKTADSGQNWTDVTGDLPDAPTSAVAIDPLDPNTVFVGNDVGVFVTRDAGATWAAYSEDLPEAVLVLDLVVVPEARSLLAATHGNGMYRRSLIDNPVTTESGAAPDGFRLSAAAPNPFRTQTALTYELDASAEVRLEVFDATGRRVAVLAEGSHAAGAHRVTFAPEGLAAGVYIARLTAGERVLSRRLTLVR